MLLFREQDYHRRYVSAHFFSGSDEQLGLGDKERNTLRIERIPSLAEIEAQTSATIKGQ